MAKADTMKPLPRAGRTAGGYTPLNLMDDPEFQAILKSDGKTPFKGRKVLLEEATVAFGNAVRDAPDVAEYHYNLASALTAQNLFTPALAQYGEAARLDPAYRDAS